MDFDAPNIICAVLFSLVGFVYFSYGKRQSNFRMLAFGMGLMTYSYVTPTLTWNIIAGTALTIVPLIWR